MSKEYKDILYEVRDGVVNITINRPDVYNAFRNQTLEELIDGLRRADEEKSANVMVLSGAGDKAFCTGGDQKVHLSEDGLYGPRGTVGMPIEEMQTALRDLRKVSIAKVQGFAIGGGNVFATLCDLTIASEKATFGQVGPKVGSVDPGWGTAYLARIVGEKKAREIWFLCRKYSAADAEKMGLVNKVVPGDQLVARAPISVAGIRQIVKESMGLMDHYELERAWAYSLMTLDDTAAMRRATVERSPRPEFAAS